MQIALIDDDPLQAATLRTHLERELIGVGDVAHRITEFPSGEEFLSVFEKGKFDLILLDIYMGGMNGVETAYEIRKRDVEVLLAFCTSSNEFASESFEVGARFYLRKPVTAEGISTMLRRLSLDDVENNRAVTLPDGKPVRARSILYTEVADHAVTLYLKNSAPVRVRTSHTEIESLLSPLGYFYSPSKGIVVNLYEVEAMGEDFFRMQGGTTLPIVRRKKKEAKEVFDTFRFQKMKKERQR
jgi:DNA-binding LytR/AlgR family response regulator